MAGTRTSRVTGTLGTASEEGRGIEGPQDVSDVLGIESEIGGRDAGRSPPRRSPLGGLDLGKPGTPRRGIGIDIGKSEAGNLGIGIEIPIPIPAPISAKGKVAIDPSTGKIRGGGLGVGVGKGPIGFSLDIGVDTPPGSDKLGCFKYVTVSVGIFSHTFGKNECEPKPPTPAPSPTPAPTPAPAPTPIKCKDGEWKIMSGAHRGPWETEGPKPLSESLNIEQAFRTRAADVYYGTGVVDPVSGISWRERDLNEVNTRFSSPAEAGGWVAVTEVKTGLELWGDYAWIPNSTGLPEFDPDTPEYRGICTIEWKYKQDFYDYKNEGSWKPPNGEIRWASSLPFGGCAYDFSWSVKNSKPAPPCKGETTPTPTPTPAPTPAPTPTSPPPSSSTPIPNPPPRKKMDTDCCKRLEILQLETLRMLGRQVVGGKLAPVSNAKGFLGEEIERTKTPIKDARKPEVEKIKFSTLYQLLSYQLEQANDLDVALDPKSYKVPKGYLQNPKYSRDPKISLTSNEQPDKDASGNKRELKIHEDEEVKFSGFIQQQSYVFEAVKRLEYLFPSGELDDAKIASGLLIPGKAGEIKIHNMIMAYEILIQYINATLGNPRENLIIKDANPAIAGDQPIEVKALTISDWMRQIIKFQVDTGGDLDAAVNLMLRDFRTNMANRTDIVKSGEMIQALFEDSGMREQQDYISLHLEGDPYAGQWIKGQGFQSNPDLEKKTEESTEKVLQETLKPTDIKIKVSRRHKDEKNDMRDLLQGLANFVQRLLSIPTGGDATKSIDKLIESAKFKVQTDMALIRQNVVKAATASRNRTKKRKK